MTFTSSSNQKTNELLNSLLIHLPDYDFYYNFELKDDPVFEKKLSLFSRKITNAMKDKKNE